MYSSYMPNRPHPPESAGAIMVVDIPTTSPTQTVGEVRAVLANARDIETFNYIYVVNDERRLIGVVSIKALFQCSAKAVIGDIMTEDVVSAGYWQDQEQVAQTALQQKLKSIPVVDEKDQIIGVVPFHTILDVLDAEHTEDALQAAGLSARLVNQQNRPLFHARHRLPWLLLGLAGGIVAAFLIESFEAELAKHTLLAAFIPLVVYLADAAGVQAQTIYIRLISRSNIDFKAYFGREFLISMIVSLVLSLSIFLVVAVGFNDTLIAGIVAGAVLVSVLLAIGIAIILPWLFVRIDKDPAVASGPMSTIIVDILSIIVYFSIAQFLLNQLS